MRSRAVLTLSCLLLGLAPRSLAGEDAVIERALALEKLRIEVIRKVEPAVAAVFKAGQPGGGSGVIISPEGYCLTNFHVSGFSREMRVGLPDGKVYKAVTLGIDPTADIALLRVFGRKRFPWAPLGDSDKVRVGEWGIAMGNPFLLATDFKPTVTLGVVSGTRRFLPGSKTNLVYSDCIQIDTPINPGNSGGPLFNSRGEVIGINGRISLRDRGRVFVGSGFAISINQVKNFLPDLRAGRHVLHGTFDATVADAGSNKVVIAEILENGPADRAGLRLADQLVRFDGKQIRTANQFLNIVWTLPAGKVVEVVVKRLEAEHRVMVKLDPIPSGSGDPRKKWPQVDRQHLVWEADRLLDRHSLMGKPARIPRILLAGTATSNDGAVEEVEVEYRNFTPWRIVRTGKNGDRVVLAVKEDPAEQGYVSPQYLEVFEPKGGKAIRRTLDRTSSRALLWQWGYFFWDMLSRRKRYFDGWEYLGGDWINGVRVGGVKTITKDGYRIDWYFDENDLLVRVDAGFPGEKTVVQFDDPVNLRGSWFPSARRFLRKGRLHATVRLSSARIGKQVVRFQRAAAARAAPNAFSRAIQVAWRTTVKIYGQGYVRGIPSYGTGVLISPHGHILTYNTVMLMTPSLYAVMSDGTQRPAKVLWRDFKREIALIKIEGKNLPFIRPGEGRKVAVGQWVLSVGNAFNLAHGDEASSVNVGIVSAITDLKARVGINIYPYRGKVFIVDAAINPGSYGGPLMDLDGNLLGINGKILEATETNTQIFFCVPVHELGDFFLRARGLAPADGKIGPQRKGLGRVYTGFKLFDVSPFSSAPAYIDRILPFSPSRRAGLARDDLILRADDVRIRTCQDLRELLARRYPGDVVSLSVKRKEKIVKVKLKLEELD